MGLPRVGVRLDRPGVVQRPGVTIAGVDGVPAPIPGLEPARHPGVSGQWVGPASPALPETIRKQRPGMTKNASAW